MACRIYENMYMRIHTFEHSRRLVDIVVFLSVHIYIYTYIYIYMCVCHGGWHHMFCQLTHVCVCGISLSTIAWQRWWASDLLHTRHVRKQTQFPTVLMWTECVRVCHGGCSPVADRYRTDCACRVEKQVPRDLRAAAAKAAASKRCRQAEEVEDDTPTWKQGNQRAIA